MKKFIEPSLTPEYALLMAMQDVKERFALNDIEVVQVAARVMNHFLSEYDAKADIATQADVIDKCHKS